jgi:hypothetical protein
MSQSTPAEYDFPLLDDGTAKREAEHQGGTLKVRAVE